MDFFHTHISPKAIELVTAVLQSGWVSEGCRVKEFEAALSTSLGLLNPVAINSGTSALHLALSISGVGPGDEVILPAQTFVATGIVVLMQGAAPVFADIDLLTGNIYPVSIAEKITSRTKAIMPVHWGGYPCDLDEINDIAEQNGLAVIEDAAHALGATYKGRHIGAISRFTAFSFQAIKHLTTGDGGALCCADPEDAQKAMSRRWFGIDRTNSRPSILGERVYDIDAIGYKYHMSDYVAALGLANIEGFPERLKRCRAIAKLYRNELSNVSGITLFDAQPDRESAYWLFGMHVERREDFIRAMQGRGVTTSVVHLRIDHNSVFGGIRPDLHNQARFNETQIHIPIHDGLSDSNVEYIIESMKKGW